MKNSFKHSASVEQFLAGEMLPAEKENFEREVTTNQELAVELKLSRSIDAALRNDDIIDFRKKLLNSYKENRKVRKEVHVIHLYTRKLWYAAASFILLAALGSTLYFSLPHGSSSDTLFKEYYSADNLVDVTRSGDANIVEAVMKFQEKDYQMSARLFNNILQKDQNNFACWFYYGISAIEIENYTKAEEAFNRIVSDNQNLYVEHAQWYLGLTYLKNDQMGKAKRQFETIAKDSENFHQQDAIHLLKKLN